MITVAVQFQLSYSRPPNKRPSSRSGEAVGNCPKWGRGVGGCEEGRGSSAGRPADAPYQIRGGGGGGQGKHVLYPTAFMVYAVFPSISLSPFYILL